MTGSIELVPETGSTNADLLARLADGEAIAEGHWLVAGRQTAGRGRQGRSWIDAPGNFMGSTIVRLGERDPPPSTLSFVAALAVYETILRYVASPQAVMLKWPNDVLLDGAKFCGLLLEMGQGAVVLGIGVNLVAAPAIEGRRTDSLSMEATAPSPDIFARNLAQQLETELPRWREFGVEPILRRWQAAAHRIGTPISVHGSDGERVSGSYDGLEADGALRLKQPDGNIQIIHAGDVMLEEG